ncbi:MAG: magnesium/cobalt transporter CorA [Planctomycetaceae bacterium]|nr:magnesium/cobalt transporter CorA [Planctomycetaceae bacterium]
MSVQKQGRKRRRRFHRANAPGTPPGTLASLPGAPKPVVRCLRYNRDSIESETIENPDSWNPVLRDDVVTWVDVDGLGNLDVINRVGHLFDLHPLALEDVINVHQRPKVDMYGERLFLVVRAHRKTDTIESEQISLFLGRGFVVTFQEAGIDCFEAIRKRLNSSQGRIRAAGADYLMYAILDTVIDQYFPLLESFGEELDALDASIVDMGPRQVVREIHHLRHSLSSLRRSIWPLRDAVNALIRDSAELVTDETDVYLRDCYDHTVQLIDVLETDRELCTDLRDLHMTIVGNRMNEIMKVLTIISTIFIPLSFITGLYGMNFNPQASPYNMPELNWTFGYPVALVLMALTSGAMLVYFLRKGWLK